MRPSDQWIEDSIHWRGKVLRGPDAHWCHSWDGLPVSAFTPEYDCCEEKKTLLGRICNWFFMKHWNFQETMCRMDHELWHNERQWQMTLRVRDSGNILYTDLVAKFEKKDLRFLSQCKFISQDSKDPSTKTGSVIVRTDGTVASQGFNGFPKQMPDRTEWLNDRKEKYSRIIHCEMNALLHAREPVTGYTLYTWPCISCDRCLVHLAQAGIARFVFPTPTEDMLSRWKELLEKAEQYLFDMSLKWTEYPYEVVK